MRGEIKIFMKRDYSTLIIYDISDDKVRNKVFNILSGYGVNIQKSSFECILNKNLYNKLLSDLSKICVSELDSIKIYRLYKFKFFNIGKTININKKHYIIL